MPRWIPPAGPSYGGRRPIRLSGRSTTPRLRAPCAWAGGPRCWSFWLAGTTGIRCWKRVTQLTWAFGLFWEDILAGVGPHGPAEGREVSRAVPHRTVIRCAPPLRSNWLRS